MQMRLQHLAGPALLGVLLFGGVSAANAQQAADLGPEALRASLEPTAVGQSSLRRFALAVQSIQVIEQQAQAQMVAAIQSQGLSVERFNQIAASQQDPRQPARANLSGEDAETFNQALAEISEIRETAQQEKEAAVKQEGLNVQEFNAISQAVDQDASLRDQVIELIQKQ